MRKAELSLNLIIVAAIGLLVLIFVALIFTGKLGAWSQETGACEANKGVCRDSCSPSEVPRSLSCADEEQVCCVGLAPAEEQ